MLILELRDYKAPVEGSRLVQEALEHPIGTPRLCDMATDKKEVVVTSSDHTRPVPSHIIVPLILKEIRRGNPGAKITILISTGPHRETTREELEPRFGPGITENEIIMVHDCDDMDNMVRLGKLPSDGSLYINKLVVEVDLLVVGGFIEPRSFAGFSDGRKSVLPGVVGRETVTYNRNSAFIGDSHSRTGIIEGNPIRNDMLYAAGVAEPDFIINMVIDSVHEPIFVVAGDCNLAHRAGRGFLTSECQVDAVSTGIVISTNGGHPLDRNICQFVGGMTAAEVTIKEGEVIIMLSETADDHGGEHFHEAFRDEEDLNHMMKAFMDREPEETTIDQWQSQVFVKVTLKARIMLVSSCDDKLAEEFHVILIYIMEEALGKAKAMVDKEDYKAAVIPDRVLVIVGG